MALTPASEASHVYALEQRTNEIQSTTIYPTTGAKAPSCPVSPGWLP